MIIFKTRSNLQAEVITVTIESLTDLLATYLDMAGLFKHAHWNVKGKHFIALHKLFDEQEAVLRELADIIGERITALGGIAYGTAQSIVDFSIFAGIEPDNIYDGMEYVEFLVDRLSTIDKYLLKELEHLEQTGDKVTSNILQDHLHIIDKNLYFLEAHISI